MSHSSSDSSSPASLIQSILARATSQSGPGLPALYPVEGGSVNSTYQVTTKDNRQWFSKINDSRAFPDLLEKESRGLDLLRMQDIFRIPAVVARETARGRQVLLLEWISQGPKTPAFWTLFGEQLARLHRVSAEFNQLQSQPSQHQPGITASSESNASGSFGLSWDNYMGALPQSNTPTSRWTDFFIQQRLAPQVRLAARNDLLDSGHIRSFERLYPLLPGIFPEEAPSLLHGDLWSGNFLCDEHSQPVLIDPAVYFGHRSMDMAMTTLFGGFDPGFYEAYTYHFPFPANYREQWEICNLYPLLIHLNLFGKSYQGSILHTIQRF